MGNNTRYYTFTSAMLLGLVTLLSGAPARAQTAISFGGSFNSGGYGNGYGSAVPYGYGGAYGGYGNMGAVGSACYAAGAYPGVGASMPAMPMMPMMPMMPSMPLSPAPYMGGYGGGYPGMGAGYPGMGYPGVGIPGGYPGGGMGYPGAGVGVGMGASFPGVGGPGITPPAGGVFNTPAPFIPPNLAQGVQGWGAGYGSYPGPGYAQAGGSCIPCSTGVRPVPVLPVPGGPAIMGSCGGLYGTCGGVSQFSTAGAGGGGGYLNTGGATIIDMRQHNAWDSDDSGAIDYATAMGLAAQATNVYPMAYPSDNSVIDTSGLLYSTGNRSTDFTARTHN